MDYYNVEFLQIQHMLYSKQDKHDITHLNTSLTQLNHLFLLVQK